MMNDGGNMEDNILQGDEFDMDIELFELRKQFNEMKRERVQTQKNLNVMENKKKLLEEHKLYPNIKPNKTYYQFLSFNDFILF